MPILEMKVPTVGESINEVTLASWLVEEGAYVQLDDLLCELESDKATFELPAEGAGVVTYVAEEGADLEIGAVVCTIDTDAEAPAGDTAPKQAAEEEKAAPAAKATPAPSTSTSYASGHPSPAAGKILAEKGISASDVNGTGKDGRITKSDAVAAEATTTQSAGNAVELPTAGTFSREVRRETMSRLRRTIASHLVASKNETAMLTTFNEINMEPAMNLRTKFKKKFEETHGVRLGFMSLFTKAVCNALKEFPAVNGMIDGKEIIYNDFVDLSVAVSTPKGLVVPVLRNAESLSLAQIESGIKDLALRGRDGKLTLDEMDGGTFTITNGGVFGSLLSTPIINAPQSAILGMHKIEERPMAVNGQVVIKKMMYVALSYDHRIIDGKESVGFLVKVKENLENPEMMLFGKDPVELLLGL